MVVFYFLLLIPMIVQHIRIRGHHIAYEKRNTSALTFFFVFLTVLAMLRHKSVGADTSNYMHIFVDFDRMNLAQAWGKTAEVGYSLFNKIVLIFTKNPQVFLSISAAITMLLIYPTYKRVCTDASLTIVLFCTMSTFVMLFSGIRQMLAIGVGFIAYEFVREKKLIPFLLAVALAMTLHTSAFMLLFMYPLYHANITKKWLWVVIPVIILVFVFNKVIFSALAFILARYTKYDGSVSSTNAYTMLILFGAFAVFSFVIPDESRLDHETVGMRNFLLFAMVLQMFAPLHTLAMRMNYYYIIFIPLLLPKIIACKRKRWNQVAKMARHVLVIFFLVYFFYNAYTGRNLNVFPYHFFWEELV